MNGRAECPEPNSLTSDQENVLFWGQILDGKDHDKGKHAYDWHGFGMAYDALKFLMEESPNEPMTYERLMKARHVCCNSKAGKNFGWAGTDEVAYEGPVFKSYTCLECNHMKKLLDDVPTEFFKIKKGTNKNLKHSPTACSEYSSVLLKPKSVSSTESKFKELLTAYNEDVAKITTDEEKLHRLASFLKDYAFLHPWGNGNGRFRALMLNHEVRRLGLGCGTLMYNNNKDLYYITKDMYREKIKEGLAAYDTAMETGKSPWVDADFVESHKTKYHPNITMPGLMNCRKAEYTKTSLFKEKIEESEETDGVNIDEMM